METQLKTAIIQSDLVWEDPKQNRLNFTKKIDTIKSQVDLIILQEMFTTGFTNNASKVAETMQGETVQWMLKKANEKNALLLGSVIIEDSCKYYNRFIVAFPNGEVQYYNKRHLFSYAGEDRIYSKGLEKLVFEYRGWKILPLVCYDLRFPVWARNTENYDLIIYVANWPKPRIAAWDILLKARAIENLSYVVGVNRIGKDFNGFEYVGHSVILNAFGQTILEFKEGEAGTKRVLLDKNHVINTREKFGFLNDKDNFKIL